MEGLEQILELDGSITSVTYAPGEPDNLYITMQNGLFFRYNLKSKELSEPILDMRPDIERVYKEKPMGVNFPDERGFLRVAFHPEFNTLGSLFNGVFIAIFSNIADPSKYDEISKRKVPNPDNMTCIAQFRIEKGFTAEQVKTSRMDILCVPEPQANHNGGAMLFGPDGFLWVGLGDGGGANDEHGELLIPGDNQSFLGFSQDLETYHGKILRFEIVQPMPQAVTRIVPQSNPFCKMEGIRKETIAWGLRNPWSMDFTDDFRLFIGDVGQNRFESIKELTGTCTNFGWRAYEGTELFSKPVLDYIQKKGEKVTPPIIEYGREEGIAIVGVIYDKGKDRLVFADHGGNIFEGKKEGDKWTHKIITNLPYMIHGMNKDSKGNIYPLAYNPDANKGFLFKLTI